MSSSHRRLCSSLSPNLTRAAAASPEEKGAFHLWELDPAELSDVAPTGPPPVARRVVCRCPTLSTSASRTITFPLPASFDSAASKSVVRMCFSSNSVLLATAHKNGLLCLWDCRRNTVKKSAAAAGALPSDSRFGQLLWSSVPEVTPIRMVVSAPPGAGPAAAAASAASASSPPSSASVQNDSLVTPNTSFVDKSTSATSASVAAAAAARASACTSNSATSLGASATSFGDTFASAGSGTSPLSATLRPSRRASFLQTNYWAPVPTRLTPHKLAPLLSLAFSQDDSLLAVGCNDGAVHFVELSPLLAKMSSEDDDHGFELQSPTNATSGSDAPKNHHHHHQNPAKHSVFSDSDNENSTHDTASSVAAAAAAATAPPKQAPSTIPASPQSVYAELVSYSTNRIREQNSVTAVVLSDDGRYCVTATAEDYTVRVWEVEEAGAMSQPVTGMSFGLPSGTTTANNSISLIKSPMTPPAAGGGGGGGSQARSNSRGLGPGASALLGGAAAATKGLLRTFRGHMRTVYALAFEEQPPMVDAPMRVASASRDGTVRVWSFRPEEQQEFKSTGAAGSPSFHVVSKKNDDVAVGSDLKMVNSTSFLPPGGQQQQKQEEEEGGGEGRRGSIQAMRVDSFYQHDGSGGGGSGEDLKNSSVMTALPSPVAPNAENRRNRSKDPDNSSSNSSSEEPISKPTFVIDAPPAESQQQQEELNRSKSSSKSNSGDGNKLQETAPFFDVFTTSEHSTLSVTQLPATPLGNSSTTGGGGGVGLLARAESSIGGGGIRFFPSDACLALDVTLQPNHCVTSVSFHQPDRIFARTSVSSIFYSEGSGAFGTSGGDLLGQPQQQQGSGAYDPLQQNSRSENLRRRSLIGTASTDGNVRIFDGVGGRLLYTFSCRTTTTAAGDGSGSGSISSFYNAEDLVPATPAHRVVRSKRQQQERLLRARLKKEGSKNEPLFPVALVFHPEGRFAAAVNAHGTIHVHSLENAAFAFHHALQRILQQSMTAPEVVREALRGALPGTGTKVVSGPAGASAAASAGGGGGSPGTAPQSRTVSPKTSSFSITGGGGAAGSNTVSSSSSSPPLGTPAQRALMLQRRQLKLLRRRRVMRSFRMTAALEGHHGGGGGAHQQHDGAAIAAAVESRAPLLALANQQAAAAAQVKQLEKLQRQEEGYGSESTEGASGQESNGSFDSNKDAYESIEEEHDVAVRRQMLDIIQGGNPMMSPYQSPLSKRGFSSPGSAEGDDDDDDNDKRRQQQQQHQQNDENGFPTLQVTGPSPANAGGGRPKHPSFSLADDADAIDEAHSDDDGDGESRLGGGGGGGGGIPFALSAGNSGEMDDDDEDDDGNSDDDDDSIGGGSAGKGVKILHQPHAMNALGYDPNRAAPLIAGTALERSRAGISATQMKLSSKLTRLALTRYEVVRPLRNGQYGSVCVVKRVQLKPYEIEMQRRLQLREAGASQAMVRRGSRTSSMGALLPAAAGGRGSFGSGSNNSDSGAPAARRPSAVTFAPENGGNNSNSGSRESSPPAATDGLPTTTNFQQQQQQQKPSLPDELYVQKTMPLRKDAAFTSRMDADIMSNCMHPFIVQYVEQYESFGNLNLIMEYCGGGDVGRKLDALEEAEKTMSGEHTFGAGALLPIKFEEALALFTEACLGVEYMHNSGMAHKDIKTQNVLLDDDGFVRLTDFGFSTRLYADLCPSDAKGTPRYIAPEIWENLPHGTPVDVWALGVLFYLLLTARHPFDVPESAGGANNMLQLSHLVTTKPYLPMSTAVSFLPNAAPAALMAGDPVVRRIVDKMLIKDPSRRATAAQVLAALEKHFGAMTKTVQRYEAKLQRQLHERHRKQQQQEQDQQQKKHDTGGGGGGGAKFFNVPGHAVVSSSVTDAGCLSLVGAGSSAQTAHLLNLLKRQVARILKTTPGNL